MQDPAPHPESPSKLEPSEITAVLPAFGLGRIRSVREFPRGRAHAPMALVVAKSGAYLLKRRAESSGGLERVELEHSVQADLSRHGVPTALAYHGGPTAIEASGRVYEITRFIKGEPARTGLEAARAAGATLARIHATPHGSHRLAPGSSSSTSQIDTANAHLLRSFPALRVPLESLQHDWHVCVDRLDRHDEGTNGSALLHGDYHPGNLIWRGPELAAVIDFEALGTGPCAQELASAALLFSLETPGRSPEAWPESPDIPRLTAFTAGYAESMAEARADIESVLDPAAQPWWMIHGLIAQAVPRACRLDGFGRHEMSEVVPFIARISAWIRDHADGLALVLADELASGHRPGG